MLKKCIFIFLIIIALFSFNHHSKAMEQHSQAESLLNIENLENRSIYSLTFIVALRVKESKLNLRTLTTELREFCNTISLIDSYCTFLQKMNSMLYPLLNVTEENIACHKRLLQKILDSGCIDLDLVLPVFAEYFESMIDFFQLVGNTSHASEANFIVISLEDLNITLRLMIKCAFQHAIALDQIASKKEMMCLNKVVIQSLSKNYGNLCVFLANAHLFPSLDYVMYGDEYNTFMNLASSHIDIDIFNFIIDKESHKDYDWVKLLSINSLGKNTVFHAALYGSKDIVEAIITLIDDKGLMLDDFINARDNFGKTPLMEAASFGFVKVLELLLNHGAKRELKCNNEKIALNYAKDRIEWIDDIGLRMFLSKELLEKMKFDANKCLQLLS